MASVFTAAAPSAHALEVPARALNIRRSEWVLLAFLLYAQALDLVLPTGGAIHARLLICNSIILAGYLLLVHFDSVKPTLFGSVTRDWLPLAIILLGYQEMGWFARPHAGNLLESRWIVWDRLILRNGGKAAIESLGPVLPSFLEIAYSLVYALAPFSVTILYVYGGRKRVDRFLFTFALGVLLCYAQFPFWPSEPPRVVFLGQDAPAFVTVFRRLNLWMLGNYGIHTSVFPSAHVAGAFAAALGLRRAMPAGKGRWAVRVLLSTAVLIAIATVYGRYHYAADATAGLIMAGVAVSASKIVESAVVRRQYLTSSWLSCSPVSGNWT